MVYVHEVACRDVELHFCKVVLVDFLFDSLFVIMRTHDAVSRHTRPSTVVTSNNIVHCFGILWSHLSGIHTARHKLVYICVSVLHSLPQSMFEMRFLVRITYK